MPGISGTAIGIPFGGSPPFAFDPAETPSGLTATIVTDTQVDLVWTSNSAGIEEGFSIERSADLGVTYAVIDTTLTGDVTYSDGTVVANTVYYYRVRAFLGVVFSAYSNVATVDAGDWTVYWTAYWLTKYPSSLLAIASTDTQINLTWTNNGVVDYDGVSIERGTDGITYAEIDTGVAGDVAYSDTTCVADTLYYYRIRYYRGANYSAYNAFNFDSHLIPSDYTLQAIIDDGNTLAYWDFFIESLLTKTGSEITAAQSLLSGPTASRVNVDKPILHERRTFAHFNKEITGYYWNVLRANFGAAKAQPLCVISLMQFDTLSVDQNIWSGKTALYYGMNMRINDAVSPYGVEIIAGTGWVSSTAFVNAGQNRDWHQVSAKYSGAGSFGLVDTTKGADANAGAASVTSFEIGGSTGYGTYTRERFNAFMVRQYAHDQAGITSIANFLSKKYVNRVRFDKPKLLFNFDNNGSTWQTIGWPYFIAKGIVADWYTQGNTVGTGGYVTWAQLLTAHNNGQSIQCHTWDHADLTTLTEVQLRAEFTNNDAAFIAAGLPTPRHMAYPAGTGSNTWAIKAIVNEYRMTGRDYGAFTTAGYFTFYRDCWPMKIPAWRVDSQAGAFNVNDFKTKMAVCAANNGAIIAFGHDLATVGPTPDVLTSDLDAIIAEAIVLGFDIIDMETLYGLLFTD